MSLRSLPSVDAALATPEAAALLDRVPRALATDAVRVVLDQCRKQIRSSDLAEAPSTATIITRADVWIQQELGANLPSVVNATGIVLHTNLGRAPLAPAAIESLAQAARQTSAIEFDVSTGTRGHRDDHVSRLLADLTGAEAGMVVNNNAAALLLAVDSLASRREVIVSRGELIEIGGAFRLPDVLRRAGAVLREVGTTNRTRVEDYAKVLSRRTALILRAHPSNYRVEGFTEQPGRADLARLAHEHGIPFVEDLGSGALVDLRQFGVPHEPTPAEAIRSGVDIVTFSGDKLLGGPQAGLLVGKADLIAKLQKNPVRRALRVDKLILAALRATLTLYRTSNDLPADLPTLGLLARTEERLDEIAREAHDLLREALPAEFTLQVIPSESEIGSGAQPTITLPSRAIRVRHEGWDAARVAHFFRSASPAILGRIAHGDLLLDLRAVPEAADLLPHGIETSES
ncbi:MAG: L-seryl-tRNA(Sec) selenium transferase [Candidatus Binatia bacterium]|nr:L-seryl-tRNA(Sec) selenium transferase [Candidatus Binatia bacterium]